MIRVGTQSQNSKKIWEDKRRNQKCMFDPSPPLNKAEIRVGTQSQNSNSIEKISEEIKNAFVKLTKHILKCMVF